MSRTLPACVALVALLAAFPVTAQTQNNPAPNSVVRLGEFIRTPAHLTALRAAITAFEPNALLAVCRDLKPVRGRSWKPLEEPVFEGASHAPRTAAWQEVWEVDACGKTGVRSVGFVARPNQGVVPLPMFPGESLADLKLQVDAGQTALSISAPAALRCTDRDTIQVSNSAVVNRAALNTGRWTERWTVAGCGRTADIEVEFSPGPQGRPVYEFRNSGTRR
jgi:hypothetical protein